ncbi:hypothetical protein [Collinsella aerofaciens]|uniref:hypothetical protein n=1 Tax=Collinsella aerofaciens TaxID=74426 RepID=UPI001EDE592D|nr:hypothetical protein [Collinsella aerofaciens]MCG5014366.1 hypothetical protein [Collinsella aerofaciens]
MQAEDEKTEGRSQLIDQGSKLFATACYESGIDVSNAWPVSDEELKRSAYSDRYDEETDWL